MPTSDLTIWKSVCLVMCLLLIPNITLLIFTQTEHHKLNPVLFISASIFPLFLNCWPIRLQCMLAFLVSCSVLYYAGFAFYCSYFLLFAFQMLLSWIIFWDGWIFVLMIILLNCFPIWNWFPTSIHPSPFQQSTVSPVSSERSRILIRPDQCWMSALCCFWLFGYRTSAA